MVSITSAILYGRRNPNFKGQDGRVVKAGALGGAHVKSWDQLPGRTSCLYTKNPKAGRLVLKSRPVVIVTMADID